MKRYAATLDLVADPVAIAAYLAHHRAVWVEVMRGFRGVGVLDLRIWRAGSRLFYEMEVEDGFEPGRDFARYAASHPSNPVWESLMASFQVPLPDRKAGEHWSSMELAFDFKAALHTLDSGEGLRVDAHQHFWNYSQEEYGWITPEMANIARSFGPEELHPLLSGSSLHGCVAVQARCDQRENDWLLHLAEQFPFIFGVVGWLNLAAPNLESQLAALEGRRKLVGFREVLQGKPRGEWLTEDFLRGVSRIGQLGYTYDILVYGNQLGDTADFLRRCRPDQRFVLDHLGKPPIRSGGFKEWEMELRALARDFPNLSCKLSGLVTEAEPGRWTEEQLRPYMETVVDAFGPERVMYGSDWPVCLVAVGQYAEVYHLVRDYVGTLGKKNEAAIFGGNAVRFYGLSAPFGQGSTDMPIGAAQPGGQ